MSRIIGWFSCGIASATAIKMTLEQHRIKPLADEFIIAYTYIENEHHDSMRFLKECEKWYDQKILILKNDKYNANVDRVIEKTRYMSGANGARCTLELKRKLRWDFQQPDDIHIFGFTIEERNRIDDLIDAEPDVNFLAPLIERDYDKLMCFEFFKDSGIEKPAMYKLGYNNNNCIGCLKADGAGYWNKIRIDFPEVFERRAYQEKMLNVSLVRLTLNKFKRLYPEHYQKILDEEAKGIEILKTDKKGRCRIPLRFLPEDAGEHKDLNIGGCGFLCELLK